MKTIHKIRGNETVCELKEHRTLNFGVLGRRKWEGVTCKWCLAHKPKRARRECKRG